MDIHGQITVEFVLIIGIILPLVLGILSYMGQDIELAEAMASARSGAVEGANIDSFAIYPEDSFNNNNENHPRLLSPSSVVIKNIDYRDLGYNASYNKTKIQLRITASCPAVKYQDRNPLGDRINYYARRRICECFGTSGQTNAAFNPAYSNRYAFTTADVLWV